MASQHGHLKSAPYVGFNSSFELASTANILQEYDTTFQRRANRGHVGWGGLRFPATLAAAAAPSGVRCKLERCRTPVDFLFVTRASRSELCGFVIFVAAVRLNAHQTARSPRTGVCARVPWDDTAADVGTIAVPSLHGGQRRLLVRGSHRRCSFLFLKSSAAPAARSGPSRWEKARCGRGGAIAKAIVAAKGCAEP
ncbi:hypothetical protein HPB51_002416 [Rhipicephalus microplus]|uniref:Uncharacterized protein n=1 Tax=Rhipicephalus microplus TaxID=6941 RepID=A0A9J6DT23_RHIMP|nr:hypothetical protein HPB51_002416 [Rhipicephalus microplus]